MADLILVINPGSTTTKIAVYRTVTAATKVSEGSYGVPYQVPAEYEVRPVFTKSIAHRPEELAVFEDIPAQTEYRARLVETALAEENVPLEDIACIMCRGGLVQKPQITTGGYLVDDELCEALRDPEITSPHASLLGGLIGKMIADKINGEAECYSDDAICSGKIGSAVFCGLGGRHEARVNAYIYDAVTSVELGEVEELTGFKDIKRNGTGHILNARAMAMQYAKEIGAKYEELNLIVIHTGGGSTVNAHKHGRITDCIGDDEMHMSLERSGGAPLLKFIKLCFSGKYTQGEIEKLVRGRGGVYALLGTSDGIEIEKMIKEEAERAETAESAASDNDVAAKPAAGEKMTANVRCAGEAAEASCDGCEKPVTTVVRAMAYGLAKSAASLIPALGAMPDAIIVTGGFAYGKAFTDILREYIAPFGNLVVMPGEKEMDALANGGLRILTGRETARRYRKPKEQK